MFSNLKTAASAAVSRIIYLSFAILLPGCHHNETPKPSGEGSSAAYQFERPASAASSPQLRFHGVVQGYRSYQQTVFAPGKVQHLPVVEGSIVEAGEKMAKVYSPVLSERLDHARAGLSSAKADFHLREETLARNKKLFLDALISRQALEELQRDVETAQQKVAEAQALAAQAENEYLDLTIAARERGLVSRVYKREGEYIDSGEPLLRFESLERQKISFRLPEKNAVSLPVSSPVTVYIPALHRTIAATVLERGLPSKDGPSLFDITVVVSSPGTDITGLRATLLLDKSTTPTYRIAYQALRYDSLGKAYVIAATHQFEKVYVQVKALTGYYALVAGNIDLNSDILVGDDITLPINLAKF